MSLVSGLAIYFVIWWIALLLVLPFGVKTQVDSSEQERHLGTTKSAPTKPMMVRKILATTILAAVLFGLYYTAIEVWGFGLEDLDFLPMPDSLR
ncbi:Predicted secreted protein [Cohaesibacter sp. ES.047]|uniref:DUF1467 family protein n=1 Tax=Cohaesibacter sp. ES.047 TaxID=1798205 RepID=UPI000BB6BE2D|nr:DUF1467 family protein [Cohaesibacter sp. ES.047]SNY93722.1 Predicted secreted protein [Cohaesibacter sp. ES.047]